MNKALICKKDKYKEAQEYESDAVGVYKENHRHTVPLMMAEQDDPELAGISPLNFQEYWLEF